MRMLIEQMMIDYYARQASNNKMMICSSMDANKNSHCYQVKREQTNATTPWSKLLSRCYNSRRKTQHNQTIGKKQS